MKRTFAVVATGSSLFHSRKGISCILPTPFPLFGVIVTLVTVGVTERAAVGVTAYLMCDKASERVDKPGRGGGMIWTGCGFGGTIATSAFVGLARTFFAEKNEVCVFNGFHS